jgi:hypothetical protein
MIGTMVFPLEVAPPELSRLRPRLVARPRGGRDNTPPAPLPGTDLTNADKKTHVGSPRLLRVSGPSSGPQLQSLQRRQVRAQAGPRGLVGRLHDRRLGHRGDGRRNDSVFAHRFGARRSAVATTSATTLHRQLERLQSAFHRQLPVSLGQADTAMGPQIHQAPW